MIVLLDSTAAGDGRGPRLVEGEEHHLRVRRARDGDPVELRDGAGLIGSGRLVRDGPGWSVEVEERRVVGKRPGVTLAVGAGDRERFEWLAEKATELGVAALIPVETEFTSAVATRVRPQHVAKLRRRALEALKQCGAAWLPEISSPISLATLLARPSTGERWLADRSGAAAGAVSPLAIVLVGPEGGLTPAERSAAVGAGFRPVRLGPYVLRFETAALAAAALAAANLAMTGGVDV
jgi:16S rRNA (uracil1498-N3)-methyltransferase